jgi:hypothetical protein
MEPKKTDLPAPHAGEREKGTREDGEAMPPQAADPKAGPRTVKPDSDKGSGGPPPEDIGREPSPLDRE